MKLLFATTNRGKLAELQSLVAGLPIQVLSLKDVEPTEVVEDGATLEANAIKKAQVYLERTGLPSLGDDSGLCVDALGGAPGVHSARYAGVEDVGVLGDAEARYRANNAKLLQELAGVPMDQRGAEFRCALCLAMPGQEPWVVTGVCRGRIALEARGEHGFGFDPLFDLPELGKTMAELTAEEKNRLSHRARAFQALRPHLQRLATAR
ncbi:MAG: RdgB/HAM1 family non-canonical purine NTP pyrophosphatase [Deltaproteobacteria bacterium]|nr:RdgB/HAM1 family non-canonical purine NTP pyrophosphatase [Deltaproteobacteria bacterium]